MQAVKFTFESFIILTTDKFNMTSPNSNDDVADALHRLRLDEHTVVGAIGPLKGDIDFCVY
jgi:hypothetical protein